LIRIRLPCLSENNNILFGSRKFMPTLTSPMVQGHSPRLDGPADILLFCTSKMSLLSLSLCTEPLRIANRVSGREIFRWRSVTGRGQPVALSGGLTLTPDLSIDAAPTGAPICIVLASYEPEAACTAKTLSWLRRLDRAGVRLGCVDSGAFVLGKAGVLGDSKVAIHHESIAPFEELWAERVAPDHPFIVDHRRISSGGGIDTVDMMLAIVADSAGEDVADQTAAILRYDWRHAAPDLGWSVGRLSLGMLSRTLSDCVELMQQRLEEPIPIERICRRLGVPEWKLRAVFRRHLRTTPSRYYLGLRLERARQLLRWSDLSISEVAAACGFADGATLSHAYKRTFGIAPSRERA